jgi:Ca2+-binding RTX toxin-like protein
MRSLTVLALMLTMWVVTPAAPAHSAGSCHGRTATIESNGGQVIGTEGYDVIVAHGPADIVALGGPDLICTVGGTVDAGSGADLLELRGGDVDVTMGGGLDRVLVFSDDSIGSTGTPPGGGDLDGGPGRDSIELSAGHVEARLANDAVDLDGGHARYAVSGFTTIELKARRIDARGSRGRDLLYVASCHARVAGGGGNDQLGDASTPNDITDLGCGRQNVRLEGGSGNDILFGSRGADVLVGGSGWDRADGDRGRDRCEAERETSCER